MSEVTRLIEAAANGNSKASADLLPLVYEELRQLAAARMVNEAPDHTLNATALVHEAYLRLIGAAADVKWDSRGHFFAAAAEAMRRILVENARHKKRLRHGGDWQRIPMESVEESADIPQDDLLALDEALKALALSAPLKARLVELRFFAGLSVEDAALCLDISRATADRWWSYARAWLFDFLQTDKNPKKA